MNPTATQSNRLPASHVSALQSIEDGYWWFEGRVFWAAQMAHLANQAKASYMDLGCGTGGFAREFLQTVPTSRRALIDGDDALLKLASRVSDVEIHQIDLTTDFKLPWTPSLVTCMDVLEHLPDDGKFLSRLSQQVDRGSSLIVSVPALPWLFSDWDRKLGHFRRYTERSLAKVISESGFKVVRMSYFWSFLTPAGVIRKFKRKSDSAAMEFEPVSTFTNAFLKQLSQTEWQLAKWVPIPFGTSIMAMAQKK